MKQSNLSPDGRPVVAIIGNPDGLSITLAELLIGNFCLVKIISDDTEKWQEALKHLSDKRSIEFIKNFSLKSIGKTDYLVYINAESDSLTEGRKKVSLAANFAVNNFGGTLFVLPLSPVTYAQEEIIKFAQEKFSRNKDFLGLLYIGDLLGPRAFLSEKRLFSRILKDLLLKKQIRLPKKNVDVYPVLISEVAREIMRSLFSFGGTGEKTALLSQKVSVKKFFETVKGLKKGAESITVEEKWSDVFPKVDSRILPLDLRKAIEETLDWFETHPLEEAKPLAEPKKRDVKKLEPSLSRKTSLAKKRFFVRGILVALAILVSPYILLTLGVLSSFLSLNSLKTGETAQARAVLFVSKPVVSLAQRGFAIFTEVPLVGELFREPARLSRLLLETNETIQKTLVLIDQVKELVQFVLSEEDYNFFSQSEQIHLGMGELYRDVAFLESELKEKDSLLQRLVEKGTGDFNLTRLRSKLLLGEKIAEEFAWLFGAEEPKKYLILFQDNTELRPTGGFIGPVALVSFNEGRLVGIDVHNVFALDEELKGQVEPPAPIKDYLGEGSWFFRDSNWDPDFPTSAERAEWFLDKEINEAVDGVIAIDFEVARFLLKETGPIYVSDFNKEVDVGNLDEILLAVEAKSDFLTVFIRDLLVESARLSKDHYLDLARGAFRSLEEKHAQVFFHNNKIQKAVSELKWDGAVYQPSCSNNCYADYLGVVEANLGVNKVNSLIKRRFFLETTIQGSNLRRTLSITYQNEADFGVSGRYENYVRVLVPQESEFNQVRVIDEKNQFFLTPELNTIHGRKEAGVFIEILPGQAKTVIFQWESDSRLDFTRQGEYGLVWRKQAGTFDDAIEIQFLLPSQIKPVFEQPFVLTNEGGYRYNTELTRDFASRIFW